MFSDMLVIGVFAVLLLACLLIKKINFNAVAISFCYYCCTVLYASKFLGTFPPWYDHAVYAMMTVPFILISSLVAAAGIAIYGICNIAVALDYIFYPDKDTIISDNFFELQLTYAAILIITSAYKGQNNVAGIADFMLDCLDYCKRIIARVPQVENK